MASVGQTSSSRSAATAARRICFRLNEALYGVGVPSVGVSRSHVTLLTQRERHGQRGDFTLRRNARVALDGLATPR